jgi:KDO2-lipid IV(A) lauroyltransferase
MGLAALLRVIVFAAGLLPGRLVGVAGAVLGWLAGTVLRIRRAHVEGAMRAAGIADPPREARAMYRSLGASAVELLRLASGRDDALARVTIDPGSVEAWREARAGGQGVVVAASHTGNWDLAACAMARETELLVVTKRLRVRALDELWQSTRARRGVRLAGAEGAMARARAVLRAGGAVAMMIDQAPASPLHASIVPFLGRPALADRAPAVLAAASGAPLVVAASHRDGRDGHVLHVLAVLRPPARPSRAWIDEATCRATRELDAFVRAHPSQWLWLHRRWKGAGASVDAAAGEGMLCAPWAQTPSSSRAGASRAG